MQRILPVLLSLVVVSTANATLRNVPASYPTIQAAINAAASGDTVMVAPGTYIQNVTFAGKAITVMSTGGRDVTFIEAATQTTPIVSFTSGEGSGSILDGFTVRNVSESNCILCSSSNPRVRNCVIEGSSLDGLRINSASPIVTGNTFQNNGQYPVYLSGSSNARLQGNTYVGNGVQAIGLSGGTQSNADRTFYADAVPYRLLSDFRFPPATYGTTHTLTFLPGVIIKSDSGVGIEVYGLTGNNFGAYVNLRAIGTSDSLVTFTSWNGLPGGWKGLYFYYGWWESTSAMEYCVVENAGQPGFGQMANIYNTATSGVPSMSNCIIRNSSQNGLFLGNSPPITGCTVSDNARHGLLVSSASPIVTGNTFQNNGQYPVYLSGSSSARLQSNTYVGNGVQAIGLSGGTQSTADRTFYADAVPYRLLSDFRFPPATYGTTHTLTFLPGVTIKSDSGVGIEVYGLTGNNFGAYVNLRAIGTSDSMVTFTSWNGLPGGWKGLYFHYGYWAGTSAMEYCVVENAGQAGFGQMANIYNTATSGVPSMSNCIIRNSSQDGLFLGNSPPIINCIITGNTRHGIYCAGSASPVIGEKHDRTCQIAQNGGFELYNATGNTIKARYNYWGYDDSVAIESDLYDCDDAAVGCVLFQPSVFSRDAACIEILAPLGLVPDDTIITPRAVVQNAGWEPITFPVVMRIGRNYTDTSFVTTPLAHLAIDTIEFAPWTAVPTKAPSYVVACSTALATDARPSNDGEGGSVGIGQQSEVVIYMVTPNSCGNNGSVLITIVGENFVDGASVTLGTSTDVEPAIAARVIAPESLLAIVYLEDVAIGTYDLSVKNPNGDSAVFYEAFDIEAGRAEAWVGISSRDLIRVGRPATIEFKVMNLGNIDLFGTLVEIGGIPLDVQVTPQFVLRYPSQPIVGDSVDWSAIPVVFVDSTNQGQVPSEMSTAMAGPTQTIPLYYPYLPVGASSTLRITVNDPSVGDMEIVGRIPPIPPHVPPPIPPPASGGGDDPHWNCIFDLLKEMALTLIPGISVCHDAMLDLVDDVAIEDVYGLASEGSSTVPMSTPQALVHPVVRAVACAASLFPPATVWVNAAWQAYSGFKALAEFVECESSFPQSGATSMRIQTGGSYDPNDLVGPNGFGPQHHIPSLATLDFRVYFENVDDALFPADTIWVTDTLSANLDWSTLTLGGVHPGNGPDSIRPTFNVLSDFDPYTGVISWGLYGINLPPDTAPYWGEGWLSYSVKPKSNLPTGALIESIAAIKFDVNDWILAPMDSIPIFNTIDAGSPASSVVSLPETAQCEYFTVCWDAQDDSGGSGIASVDVYFSENSGPDQLWLTADTSACSTFVGALGSTYAFYTISRDNVGHVESAPSVPDEQITVPSSICACFADPLCDSVFNVVDVVEVIDRAFRGQPALIDADCPWESTDLNCNGTTDVIDVVLAVDVAFRGADPLVKFCEPCP